ncbi:Cof-type HAD-IIB family hydrolase [Streptococcus sp. S784/96/1]|uniref:Cof-type HAD-IIB family hydrolase n=1 Tax=Streptococcus sp. S784/96/1 TaxID=2653499 RepID=UPI001EE47DA1|nr:HAD family hydrolase [Streptococcus sp. S784/96/1]
MIKLIATDLDGTFLTKEHTYDKTLFAKVLDKCEDRGILFTVASGRPMLSVQRLFSDVLSRIAIIAENGSVVSYKGKVISEHFMSPEQYLAVAEQLENLSDCHGYLLSGRVGAYAPLNTRDVYFNRVSEFYEKTQKMDLTQITDDIYKLTAQFSDDLILEHSRALTDKNSSLSAVVTGFGGMDIILDGITAVVTGFGGMDIILDGITKATGLEDLCHFLGLNVSEVIAFGDNFNDAEMLSFAGTAVATANAREGIKEIADKVIGSCEDGAVLTYLEGMLNE